MLARSMAASPAVTRATNWPPPATSWASTGISSTFNSTPMVASRSISSKRPRVSRPSRSRRGHHQDFSGLYNVEQAIQARSLEHGACDDVLVDTDGVEASAVESQPLVLQRVGSAVPATGYPGVTVDRRICYLAQAGCRKRGLTTPQGLLMSLLPAGEGTFPTIMRDPRIGRRQLYTMNSIQNPQGRGAMGRAGGNSHCQAISHC